MFRPVVAASTFFLFALTISAQTPPRLRLPGDVRPLRYELDLRLVPAEDNYSGRVSVEIEAIQPVQTIWLNAANLKLTRAVVNSGTNAQIVPGGTEFVGLTVAKALPP